MNATSGLETIDLLLRRDPLNQEMLKVLPGEVDAALRSVKGQPNLNNAEFLREYLNPIGDVGQPHLGTGRFIHSFFGIDNPIYELTCAARDRLTAPFDLIRTLTASNVGKRKAR